jgi:aldose 1-epimerase
MAMSLHSFGTAPGGVAVTEARLALPSGLTASILDRGAVLRDLQVPAPVGGPRRVVLGYLTLEGYLADRASLGAVNGRYANRIAAGRFVLDGVEHRLSLNENGRTHLHGGTIGFRRRLWRILGHDEASVTLGLTSPDGEEGYPGTLEARCTYRLVPPATLRLELEATTDAPTIVNLAHHPYFTFAPGQPVGDHQVEIDAEHYTPVDPALIPTGEIAPVAGTRYDFRALRPIDAHAARSPSPYDINFVPDRPGPDIRRVARVLAPDRSLLMEVHTTEPGLQFYDASKLTPTHPGLDGQLHFPRAGVCLEPQAFPDAPNHPNFPPAVLRPGGQYRQITEYRFSHP